MRPYNRYTYRLDTTDARAVRPYNGYTYRLDTMDAQSSVPTTITRPKRFLSNL